MEPRASKRTLLDCHVPTNGIWIIHVALFYGEIAREQRNVAFAIPSVSKISDPSQNPSQPAAIPHSLAAR